MVGHVDARPFFGDALNARAAPSTSAVALLRIAFCALSTAAIDLLLGNYQGLRLVW